MGNYKQQVIEFFSHRIAYDQEGPRHPREADLLLRSVPLREKQSILDIATGTGLVAIAAAQNVGREGHVVGVDFSPIMLDQARRKIEAIGLDNIELMEADADSLDFDPSSFDVIFCCSAITYLPDIPGTLRKWYRWLKPKGIVAFTCPAETAYMAPVQVKVCAELFNIALPHINEPLGTLEKCQKLLAQVGFRAIEITIDPAGKYLSLDSHSWKGDGFYPRGNPLSGLSEPQLEQLQIQYQVEVEQLATDEGIWQDMTTFFVRAQK